MRCCTGGRLRRERSCAVRFQEGSGGHQVVPSSSPHSALTLSLTHSHTLTLSLCDPFPLCLSLTHPAYARHHLPSKCDPIVVFMSLLGFGFQRSGLRVQGLGLGVCSGARRRSVKDTRKFETEDLGWWLCVQHSTLPAPPPLDQRLSLIPLYPSQCLILSLSHAHTLFLFLSLSRRERILVIAHPTLTLALSLSHSSLSASLALSLSHPRAL